MPAAATPIAEPPAEPVLLPTLFGEGYGIYKVRKGTFVLSFLLHTLGIIVLLTSSFYVASHRDVIQQKATMLIAEVSPYVLPPAPTKVGGGGGGGDRDKLEAPHGALPKLSDQQITPPAVVIRNPDPKLAVEPTVVVPPNIPLPQVGDLGDPMSKVFGTLSNGTGSGSGIGSGHGGGVGSGYGPGVGPGYGGGIGGGVYRVGGGVSAPKILYGPDPEYSEEARKAKYQGTVVMWLIVGTDGRPHDIRIVRSLGMGLDEKALTAVNTWKFEPGRRNGVAVAVQVNVEINFRLY